MRRIKQFVEVEILKNFPRLLFILLSLEIFIFIGVHIAATSALFIRADALAHEAILVAGAIKLGVLYELLQAVMPAVVRFLIAAGGNVAPMLLRFASLLFEIGARVFAILLALAENELAIHGIGLIALTAIISVVGTALCC